MRNNFYCTQKKWCSWPGAASALLFLSFPHWICPLVRCHSKEHAISRSPHENRFRFYDPDSTFSWEFDFYFLGNFGALCGCLPPGNIKLLLYWVSQSANHRQVSRIPFRRDTKSVSPAGSGMFVRFRKASRKRLFSPKVYWPSLIVFVRAFPGNFFCTDRADLARC